MTVNLTSALIYSNVMNVAKSNLCILQIQKKFCILINIALTSIELLNKLNKVKVKVSMKIQFYFWYLMKLHRIVMLNDVKHSISQRIE